MTAKAGITSTRWTLGVVAADLCGRGFQDLVLANDYGVDLDSIDWVTERLPAEAQTINRSGLSASV